MSEKRAEREAREARLKAALRDNLRKRKAQERELRSQDTVPDSMATDATGAEPDTSPAA